MRLFVALLSAALLVVPAFAAQPIARVGDTILTEEQLRNEMGAELSQIENRLYQLKKYWAERKAQELLFDQAARAAGLSREQWEKQEIDAKVAPPDENRARQLVGQFAKPGVDSMEALKQATEAVARQNREARRNQVYQELTKKTKVELLVEKPAAPRVKVKYGPQDPAHGSDKAPVTIVEFTDFECPYCKRATETIEKLKEAFPKEVKIVARQYPLPGHERAKPAAEAALCANEQGKYWEYRAKLFADQKKLGDADLRQYAKDLGLDEEKFGRCVAEGRYAEQVRKDFAEGQKYGVTGTPAFFINGELIAGAQPYASFEQAIKTALAKK